MKIAGVLGAAAMCVSLTGCYTAQVSAYCRQNPVACVAVSAVAAGGLIFLAATLLRSHQPYHHGHYSDQRLKEDIRHIQTLPQGVKVYSFRYRGDSRTYVGLMAQELLADERFRSAVGTDANGFYLVDYAALGLDLHGAWEMQQAGAAAAARAAS